MNMASPKVLIVGQPFTRHTGGGITLSNLFAGWQRDNLAVVCVDNLFDGNIDTSICDNYYRLGALEHKWSFPLNLIKSKHPSGPVSFPKRPAAAPAVAGKPKSKLREKLVMDLFIPALHFLGVFHLLSKIEMSDELRQWLDEFSPDVIYAQAPTREMVLFCIAIQEYLQKPMIYHVMDDWPSTIGHNGLLGKYWSSVVDRDLRRLLEHTTVFMSISDLMSQEYKRRYGRASLAFHNPIETDFWRKYQRSDYELANSPEILYAGRTGLGIDASLETIARAVQQVNQETGLSIRFSLQTGERPAWVSRYSCVQHRTFVPYGELPRVFAAADLLILPYDFSEGALKFIKYSMPTKASEFMASGTPILIFAPEETAIVDYAQAYGWAEVVTKDEVTQLAATIRRLVEDRTAREILGRRAVQIAENRHNSAAITREFSDIICSLHPAAARVNWPGGILATDN